MKRPPAKHVADATSELFERGNFAAIGRYFADDYVAHVTGEDHQGGHNLVGSVVSLYRSAFPDLSVQVTVLLESPESVAWLRIMKGTQVNAFKGFPGTGKSVVWSEIIVSRLSQSLIAEEWVVTNLAERLLFARKGASAAVRQRKPSRPKRGDA